MQLLRLLPRLRLPMSQQPRFQPAAVLPNVSDGERWSSAERSLAYSGWRVARGWSGTDDRGLNFRILLRKSNQNGAPREMASVVNRRPMILRNQPKAV